MRARPRGCAAQAIRHITTAHHHIFSTDLKEGWFKLHLEEMEKTGWRVIALGLIGRDYVRDEEGIGGRHRRGGEPSLGSPLHGSGASRRVRRVSGFEFLWRASGRQRRWSPRRIDAHDDNGVCLRQLCRA